ncbi:hypothetical protein Pint_26944 [Pistacia integerrima]|uniref:Uncharacterized protein n=1 Tax=Pistacia integerrima TaxID=434235 RepID=A0ACC0YS94_9ROSI|nr:hypothetical protein Pint_26944 [Pistacia integerrima]
MAISLNRYLKSNNKM